MRRWILASCLVIISALGVLAPSGAQAATAATANLTSGIPVKATISKPGQQVAYTFAATAGKNVTFNVTRFNFTDSQGPAQITLYFYEPGTSNSYTQSTFVNNGYYNFTTPESGTWKVTLVPYAATVGSLTLTFANDVPTVALTPGKPATTAIKFAGQQAGYTFAAKAGKNVTFNVTHFNFTDSQGPAQITLYFYEPGSNTAYTQCTFGNNGTCTIKTPVGGTWSITLSPYSATVGSLTLTLT